LKFSTTEALSNEIQRRSQKTGKQTWFRRKKMDQTQGKNLERRIKARKIKIKRLP
jgi:hypothetical protein